MTHLELPEDLFAGIDNLAQGQVDLYPLPCYPGLRSGTIINILILPVAPSVQGHPL